jgi:hypothetical protein
MTDQEAYDKPDHLLSSFGRCQYLGMNQTAALNAK